MKYAIDDLPKDYIQALEKYLGLELTQARLDYLLDIDFGLAMFQAGKEANEIRH